VAYTGKRHNTSQEEKEAIQNIIMRSVHQWYSKNYLKRYILTGKFSIMEKFPNALLD
jgi:hypothetical protein